MGNENGTEIEREEENRKGGREGEKGRREEGKSGVSEQKIHEKL